MSAIVPEKLAGDWTDDDGQILADQLGETSNAPKPPADVPAVQPVEVPPKTGRLITGTIQLEPGWEPVLLLPADPNRLTVVIQDNDVLSNFAWVAGDPQDLRFSRTAFVVVTDSPLTLAGYTGPLYAIAAPPPEGEEGLPANISYVAVTA
ncbi:hypothetical protein [Acrocarpospora phusangensis]|uniref:hypothetical protein n=1 Tax=Acrocarpospora phusangensis TaxID=1070424 RepID=UPI0019523E80|nr:hypothetical protein [Acrocarpospora phusangensis]